MASNFVEVKVHLKNEASVMLPGNVVEGHLEVNCTKEVEIDAIRIKFAGKETVLLNNGNFRETMIYFQDVVTVCGASKFDPQSVSEMTFSPLGTTEAHYEQLQQLHTLQQQLLQELLPVLPPGFPGLTSKAATIKMPPGSYKYPFRFNLPTNIPPSFFAATSDLKKSAEVSYFVTGVVDIHDPNETDPESTRTLSVMQMINEDTHAIMKRETAQAPVPFESGPINFCCCWGKGVVSGTMVATNPTPVLGSSDKLELTINFDLSRATTYVEALEVSVLNVIDVQSVQQPHLRQTFVSDHNPLRVTRVDVGDRGKVFSMTVPLLCNTQHIVPSTKTKFCTTSHRYSMKIIMPTFVDNITIPEFVPLKIFQNVDHRRLFVTHDLLGTDPVHSAGCTNFIGLKSDGYFLDAVAGEKPQESKSALETKRTLSREYLYQCPLNPSVPLAPVPGSIDADGLGIFASSTSYPVLNPYAPAIVALNALPPPSGKSALPMTWFSEAELNIHFRNLESFLVGLY